MQLTVLMITFLFPIFSSIPAVSVEHTLERWYRKLKITVIETERYDALRNEYKEVSIFMARAVRLDNRRF